MPENEMTFGKRTRVKMRNHLQELGCNILTLNSIYSSKLENFTSVDEAFEALKKDIYDFTVDDGNYSQTAIVNISSKWCSEAVFEVLRKFPNYTEVVTKGAHGNPPVNIFILPLKGIRHEEEEEEPDFEPEEDEHDEEEDEGV